MKWALISLTRGWGLHSLAEVEISKYLLFKQGCLLSEGSGCCLSTDCHDVLKRCQGLSLVKVAAGRIWVDRGFVGFCLNHVVLFNFLLMGLTDLISCLRGKDNLVANPLTLVWENFTLSKDPLNPPAPPSLLEGRPHWIFTSVVCYFII